MSLSVVYSLLTSGFHIRVPPSIDIELCSQRSKDFIRCHNKNPCKQKTKNTVWPAFPPKLDNLGFALTILLGHKQEKKNLDPYQKEEVNFVVA